MSHHWIPLAMAASLLAQSALSENGGRGGENAVVCFDNMATYNAVIFGQNGAITNDQIENHVVRVMALELWQVRNSTIGDDRTRGELYIEKDPFDSGSGKPYQPSHARDFVEKIAKRFDISNLDLAFMIRSGVAHYGPNSISWEPNGLVFVDDDKSDGQIPPPCAKATLASQSKVGHKYRLALDQRFLDLPEEIHEGLSKGIMFLHESIESKARDKGERDTKSTQDWVKLMITKNKAMTVAELCREIPRLDYGDYDGHSYAGAVHCPTIIDHVLDRILLDEVPQRDEIKKSHLEAWSALARKSEDLFKSLNAVRWECGTKSAEDNGDFDGTSLCESSAKNFLRYGVATGGRTHYKLNAEDRLRLQDLIQEWDRFIQSMIRELPQIRVANFEDHYSAELDRLEMPVSALGDLRQGIKSFLSQAAPFRSYEPSICGPSPVLPNCSGLERIPDWDTSKTFQVNFDFPFP